MTDHTETTAPERIWAWPISNPIFCSCAFPSSRTAIEYTLSSTVSALIADAERRGRNAAFEQAAAKCQASVDHRVSQIGKNVEDYRQRERWIAGRVQAEICRDAILALRTSPAEPSAAVATVTMQEAAQVLLASDSLGGRNVVYFACENRCRVYKFDAVLRFLAGASK